MFKGNKMKAVTFSFDDGVTQDRRLMELFDRYGLKCTFNLNSELLGREGTLVREGVEVSHIRFAPDELSEVYKGHEVAVHTLTHPTLPTVEDDNEVIRQVETDRENLTALMGYEVTGMAYPGGGVNFDERVADLIRNNTGVKYARTTKETYGFLMPTDMFMLHPTVKFTDIDRMNALADEFIALKPDRPALFYIWGHSYELDIHDTWAEFEEFMKKISHRDDIFYGTNEECLL